MQERKTVAEMSDSEFSATITALSRADLEHMVNFLRGWTPDGTELALASAERVNAILAGLQDEDGGEEYPPASEAAGPAGLEPPAPGELAATRAHYAGQHKAQREALYAALQEGEVPE
jgi:hypothetical protein